MGTKIRLAPVRLKRESENSVVQLTGRLVEAAMDLEFPRIGLIRVDAADRVLYELREGMR